MNLFCYGTLMHPRIVSAIVGRLPRSMPASLKGYQIYSVRSAPYPAIIQSDTAVVEGVVYLDINQREIQLLDEYEGKEYQREYAELDIGDGTLSAGFYVYKSQYRGRLTTTGWDYAQFVQQHLPLYLKNIRQ